MPKKKNSKLSSERYYSNQSRKVGKIYCKDVKAKLLENIKLIKSRFLIKSKTR